MLDLGAQADSDGKPGMWEHLRVEYSSFLTILMSWDDLSDPYPPKYTQNTASPNQLSARKLRHKMSSIFKGGLRSYITGFAQNRKLTVVSYYLVSLWM